MIGVVDVLRKGQVATDELVEQDTQGPEISLERVALALHDLRRHVMRGADDGVSPVPVVALEHLGRAHINKVDLALVVDDGVLGLDVPVDDVLGVQVFDCHQQGPEIKPSHYLVQDADLADGLKHLHPVDVLQQEVDVFAVLVGFVVAHD